MQDKLRALKERLIEVDDLSCAASVLNWDQSTYMPEGGAAARGRQIATLERIAHERFTDPAIGKLLDDLRDHVSTLPYDSDEVGLVRVTGRAYDRAIRLPAEFVARRAAHAAESYDIWTRARPANDFQMALPSLEKTLDLSREYSAFFPEAEHVIDPHIQDGDPGSTLVDVRRIFDALSAELIPLVQAVLQRPPIDDSVLHQAFPKDQQVQFGREGAAQLGFDFLRGRLDYTHHPFSTKFSIDDVRITTRADDDHLGDAIFGTYHEAGHGMYEQGARPEYEGTPLAGMGTKSFALHESQSRLWENLVGRSRGYWEHAYPKLQSAFPERLCSEPLETFYRAINHVERSPIRVQADELTYNLHILIRFGLEIDLLEGKVAVRDLPEAWAAAYQHYLGLTPSSDRDGALQDVHWYAGNIGGMFHGYCLGNILGAQIYAAALAAHPEIPEEIRQGRFRTLHGWLRERVYADGSKFTAAETIARLTGGEIRIEPYMTYLRTKFGELYGLD